MSLPLVSIISPTYNHAKYISDCIISVQNQTYSNWEMIIVDDGSTDQTLTIARKHAASDARIKVFTQENIGIYRLAETYNFALTSATGKYVAVLECDDVWLPEKLTLQVDAMEKAPDAVLCWGKAYRTTDVKANTDLYPSETIELKNISEFENNPIMSASIQLLFHIFYFPALTVFVRKQALDEIGGFLQTNHLPLVDLPTWVELSTKGKFVYLPLPLGKWRINSNQITKTLTVEMYKGFHALALDFYNRHISFFKTKAVSEKTINSHYERLFVAIYSRSGRYKLIRKDFVGARKDYLISIFKFGLKEPLWKIRSLVGLFFSFIHADIESFTRLIGRVSYK